LRSEVPGAGYWFALEDWHKYTTDPEGDGDKQGGEHDQPESVILNEAQVR
jgi:hypothetical protein